MPSSRHSAQEALFRQSYSLYIITPSTTKMEQLRVWFYDPSKDEHGIVNKLVALTDPPYCHCELQFEDGMACSIYMGSNVVFKQRDFDPEAYTSVHIYTTREHALRAHKLCTEAVQKQIKFSSLQMLACLSPWTWRGSNNTTFCSKLIAGILIDSGVLDKTFERVTTPSRLYRNLREVVDRQSCVHEIIDFLPGDTIHLRI